MGIVAKQSIYNSISSYIGVIIGAINTIVLFPNFFTADQFGLTRVFAAASVLFCQIGLLGTPSLMLKYFPFFKDKENKHNGFLFISLCIPLIGYTLILALAYLFKQDVISYYSGKSGLFGEYFNFIPIMLIYMIYLSVFDSYLRALYKSVIHSFLNNVLLRVCWTALIFLYYYGYLNFDEFIFYYVNAYGFMLLILVSYTIYHQQFFIKPSFKKFNKKLVKEMVTYSTFIILGASSGMFTNTIDSLMIGALLEDGLSQVAFYSIALYMGVVIFIPYQAIVRIANPIISNAWKNNDIDEIDNIYKQSSLNLLIIGTLLFLGIWLNADNIFQILPTEYAQAKYVLFFICLAKLFDIATGVNSSIIQFSSFFKLMLYFNGLLILLLIVTNYLFIPLFGIEGAALATLISIVANNSLRLIIIKYKMNIIPFELKSLVVPLIGGVTYLIVYFIPQIEPFYVDIVIRSIIITALFVVPIYYLKVSDEFNRIINKSLKLAKLKK